MYVASYPGDSVGMVNALHEVGMKARLVGGNMVGLQTTSIKTQLGPKLNGLVVYNFWVPTPATLNPEISAFLARYQAEAAKEGVDLLGYYLPPFAYAEMQVLGEAVKGAGTLNDDKLTAYLHAHTFHTILGDISVWRRRRLEGGENRVRAVPRREGQRRGSVPRRQGGDDPGTGFDAVRDADRAVFRHCSLRAHAGVAWLPCVPAGRFGGC